MRPIHAGRVGAATHHGAHESGQAQRDCDRVSRALEPLTIRRECGRDARLGIMEKGEVVAVPRRLGGEVHRSPPGEVAVFRRFRSQLGKQRTLKLR